MSTTIAVLAVILALFVGVVIGAVFMLHATALLFSIKFQQFCELLIELWGDGDTQ